MSWLKKTLKNAKTLPEKVLKVTASEFYSLVKGCSSIFWQDLCLPQDIRSRLGSFDFTYVDVLKLRKYLKPVFKEFHGDAEKYYMNLYGLLHANLLLQSFEEYTTVINILLPEIAIIFRCIIQCIARYVIHELYKRFTLSKKKKKKNDSILPPTHINFTTI